MTSFMADKRATTPGEGQPATDKCDPDCANDVESGPVREAGGTTGAGNLSPGGASRTGGATTGVAGADPARSHDLPPDA
jgi:hypothetical protein